MKTVLFKVDLLSKKVKNNITKKLESLPHIESILWLKDKEIKVTFDPDMLSAEDIRRLIQLEGCLCKHSKKTYDELCCTVPDKRRLGPGMDQLVSKADHLSLTSGSDVERVQTMAKNVPLSHHVMEETDHSMHMETKSKKETDHSMHMETKSKKKTDHSMHMDMKHPMKESGMPEEHKEHKMSHDHGSMSRWQQFKMNMSMTMDMDHGAGDLSMLKMMEDSMRFRFFISLIITIPIILYSTIGEEILNSLGFTPLQPPFGISRLLLLSILTTPVVLYGGWMFFYGAYHSLRKKNLNMSVLIAVGIGTAYIFSLILILIDPNEEPFFEAAAMLVTFVLLGHWMEMRARRGTSDSMRALFDLVPPQARLWKDGEEQLISTSDIQIGDIIILKPGDKVPVDGCIIEGESSFDESLVTGESLPVTKQVDDNVIGGSLNQSGSVKFKTTKIGSETALGQIVTLVQNAQSSKAPGQRLADKFAGYLVVLAVSAGLLTFTYWYFFTIEGLVLSLTFAIAVVVIACPDALGLATPTAVAVGTGMGAKYNILIKDAATLENISNIDAVMFDKTGTLTEGKPIITDFITVSGVDKTQMLQFMASVEAKSSHPLSNAVVEEASAKNVELIDDVTDFKNLAGMGVQGNIQDHIILVGNQKAFNEQNIDLKPLIDKINKLQEEGKTLLIMGMDGKIVAVAAASDKIKSSAYQVVSLLHDLKIQVGMISGDNKKTAMNVANQLGIDIVFAEVLPSDKANYVKQLQSEGKKVAMVGDGVNDAPALAQADVGIAIGAGTDVAIETAKVILMRSDPLDVIRGIRLSKATVRKMKQNLAWASVYNILAIPVAAGIFFPAFGLMLRPEFAALLMSLSSIIVATNAILLKRSEKDMIIADQEQPVSSEIQKTKLDPTPT